MKVLAFVFAGRDDLFKAIEGILENIRDVLICHALGILLDEYAAAGVLGKDCDDPILDTGLFHDRLHLLGYIIKGYLHLRLHRKNLMVNFQR